MDQPNKSLGQHWLHDEVILEHIASLADANTDDMVIEIGPGLGTLTQKLLDLGAKVTAVEFDKALADKLPKTIEDNNLTVLNQDILQFNFEELPFDYVVCANIPYYLTSNLIRVFTEAQNKPKKVVLLIQKEVAERICAGPGQMSLLSVWAQFNYACKLDIEVPAEMFTPPPKVDSQVVVMDRVLHPIREEVDQKLLNRIIKVGFSNKRKTLLNNFSAGLGEGKPKISEILNTLSIKPTARAQELSLENWVELTKTFSRHLTS